MSLSVYWVSLQVILFNLRSWVTLPLFFFLPFYSFVSWDHETVKSPPKSSYKSNVHSRSICSLLNYVGTSQGRTLSRLSNSSGSIAVEKQPTTWTARTQNYPLVLAQRLLFFFFPYAGLFISYTHTQKSNSLVYMTFGQESENIRRLIFRCLDIPSSS